MEDLNTFEGKRAKQQKELMVTGAVTGIVGCLGWALAPTIAEALKKKLTER